jgi:hypothetical protein
MFFCFALAVFQRPRSRNGLRGFARAELDKWAEEIANAMRSGRIAAPRSITGFIPPTKEKNRSVSEKVRILYPGTARIVRMSEKLASIDEANDPTSKCVQCVCHDTLPWLISFSARYE